ncbi:MAG: 3'-5' exonuclease domain-containing protein 2 [Saprospiraceae bacterium]|nr:3'-5' exonuclease domain-containing protein 2 [Saprospiraceae bacterium]
MEGSSQKNKFSPIPLEKKEINNLNLVQFDGPVHMITDPNEAAEVVNSLHQHDIIGFDTESKPVFKKGNYNHVSLMQLATIQEVYLLRINALGLTQEIRDLLENQHLSKVGLALQNDLHDLKKLEPFEPSGFIDIQHIMRREGIKTMGLRKLCAQLLNFRISKGAQVSNWEADTLSEKQIRYAATDAWACLKIYQKLKEMDIEV